jgi:hypothetical protein
VVGHAETIDHEEHGISTTVAAEGGNEQFSGVEVIQHEAAGRRAVLAREPPDGIFVVIDETAHRQLDRCWVRAEETVVVEKAKDRRFLFVPMREGE